MRKSFSRPVKSRNHRAARQMTKSKQARLVVGFDHQRRLTRKGNSSSSGVPHYDQLQATKGCAYKENNIGKSTERASKRPPGSLVQAELQPRRGALPRPGTAQRSLRVQNAYVAATRLAFQPRRASAKPPTASSSLQRPSNANSTTASSTVVVGGDGGVAVGAGAGAGGDATGEGGEGTPRTNMSSSESASSMSSTLTHQTPTPLVLWRYRGATPCISTSPSASVAVSSPGDSSPDETYPGSS